MNRRSTNKSIEMWFWNNIRFSYWKIIFFKKKKKKKCKKKKMSKNFSFFFFTCVMIPSFNEIKRNIKSSNTIYYRVNIMLKKCVKKKCVKKKCVKNFFFFLPKAFLVEILYQHYRSKVFQHCQFQKYLDYSNLYLPNI